jgi:lipopolysaccharide transport system ATP-binding protein
MSQPVIQVRDLGKLYRIRSTERSPYSTFREDMVNGIKRFVRGDFGQSQSEDFWALKDVSFDVHQGEVVGIIGRNGAGKSTLLKILSRIVQPTTGEAIIRGRVGSLLEVGTGFHPELTGRENIFMNGAVLGMKRAEIKRQFDAIAAFAEVDKFLDTPVKFYSSGMYVRLAFAVAAHLEPEILIVDEVLAVGDINFQKKCLGKMEDVAKKDAKTVLFVSHNMTAIQNLCKRVMWLENNTVNQQGDSHQVVTNYLAYEIKKNINGFIASENHYYHYGKPKGLTFTRIQLINHKGDSVQSILFRESLKILLDFKVVEPVDAIRIGVVIHSLDGVLISALHQTDDSGSNVTQLQEGDYSVYIETQLDIMPGRYSISLVAKALPGFWNSQNDSWDHIDNALIFTVEFEKNKNILPSGSLLLPKSKWLFKKIN